MTKAGVKNIVITSKHLIKCPLSKILQWVYIVFSHTLGGNERKQESKKIRKYTFDQESDQEKKKENTLSTKTAIKKIR